MTLQSEESLNNGITASQSDLERVSSRRKNAPHKTMPLGGMYQRALSKDSICNTMHKNCCKRNCKKKIDQRIIITERKKFWSMTRHNQTNWLYNKLSSSHHGHRKTFNIESNIVCPSAFRQIINVPTNRYYDIVRNLRQGYTSAGLSRYSITRHESKTYVEALQWLEDFATNYGDRMPHTEEVLLPYKTSRTHVYDRYFEEKRGTFSLSKSHFFKLWNKELHFLKIKKTNSFSKCNLCSILERRLQNTRNKHEIIQIREQRENHCERQMHERKLYYYKRNKAQKNPKKYLSIIIDGMDQSKTNLPHFAGRKAKCLNLGELLQTHITGAISHGHERRMTFIDIMEYPHDSNLSINILLKVLHQCAKLNKNFLPPVLYLQADNCCRENKNKYVLAFCELLIHLNIFRTVELSFLFVGHTHEDIDAFFSKISETLRTTDVETFPQLLGVSPNSQRLNAMYDVRSWISPCMMGSIKGHTRPHHFKFTRNNVGKVTVFTKGRQGSSWIALNSSFFKTNSSGNVCLPKGIPKIEIVKFDKINPESLEKQLSLHWSALFSQKHDEVKWWKNYIKQLQKLKDNEECRVRYSRNYAKWLLPLLPKLRRDASSDEEGSNIDYIPQAAKQIIDAEMDNPTVTVSDVKKRKPPPPQKKGRKMPKSAKERKHLDMHKAGSEAVFLFKQWLHNLLNYFLQNLALCGCLIVGANSRKMFMREAWIRILYWILYQVAHSKTGLEHEPFFQNPLLNYNLSHEIKCL